MNELPLSTENFHSMRKFVEMIADLSLWVETEAYQEEGEGAQADLDYLEGQDQALEMLINEARRILDAKEHPLHRAQRLAGFTPTRFAYLYVGCRDEFDAHIHERFRARLAKSIYKD